ncbi:hypothetical protein DFJ73DRAFT_573947 [Zopfochytrium polystomum]|nr:hypothetical protein DFJ73DRAFT_573947 [Zopfochytrium polystomum]
MLHSVVDLLHSNNIKSLDHINDFDDYGKTALHYALSPNLEMGLRISPKAKLLPLLKLGASAVVTAKKWKTKSVTYLASTLPKQLADEVVELLVAHSPEMDEAIKKESEMGRQAREHAIHKARALAQEDAKGVVNLVSAKKRHQEKVRKIRKEKAENEFSDQCKNANLLYVPVDTGFLRQRDYDVYIEPIEGGEGGDIHDAFLTLVDMDYNVFGMNKFYVIQLLKAEGFAAQNASQGSQGTLEASAQLEKRGKRLHPLSSSPVGAGLGSHRTLGQSTK